jgi:diguanylate cyclase (GGDEF)-like protein
MGLNLSDAFDEYPNPVYIVKPIVKDGVAEDFEYIYVNQAFGFLVGKDQEELVGKRYLECFRIPGERLWLDAFASAALERKHDYVSGASDVIGKQLFAETFHVAPNLCGCIIFNYSAVAGLDREISEEEETYSHEDLWYRAHHDYLTGCYNRCFLKELCDEMAGKGDVGVMFLDINNLKDVNDEFGHVAGDELILLVAEMLQRQYPDGMIFRVGGDEFVVITQGVPEEEFLRRSEETRALFASDGLAATGYGYYRSVDHLVECIHQCDRRMYEHKKEMKEKTWS